MTIDQIRKRVAAIEEAKGDDEAAHGMEDGLHQEFIGFVASQEGPFRALAEEVLRTQKIKFARWCA